MHEGKICLFSLLTEKVRQIQDKLEEFIQALNKEKWMSVISLAQGIFSVFLPWPCFGSCDLILLSVSNEKIAYLVPRVLFIWKVILVACHSVCFCHNQTVCTSDNWLYRWGMFGELWTHSGSVRFISNISMELLLYMSTFLEVIIEFLTFQLCIILLCPHRLIF